MWHFDIEADYPLGLAHLFIQPGRVWQAHPSVGLMGYVEHQCSCPVTGTDMPPTHDAVRQVRKSFDSLGRLVREPMQRKPAQGEVYIFINGRRYQIKLLNWEGDGLALYCKRLEKGTYKMPRQQGDGWRMGSLELMRILQGIVLRSVRRRDRYLVFKIWRQKRMARIEAIIRPGSDELVLDVGGYPGTWTTRIQIPKRIDCLNLHTITWDDDRHPGYRIRTIVGDGCALSYGKESYDIVFSNSVIEHVGDWDKAESIRSRNKESWKEALDTDTSSRMPHRTTLSRALCSLAPRSHSATHIEVVHSLGVDIETYPERG